MISQNSAADRSVFAIRQYSAMYINEGPVSCIIHTHRDKSGQSDTTQAAAERLDQMPTQDVSGFLVAATQKEGEVLQEYERHYLKARNEMAGHANIRHKPHFQLIDFLAALPLVVPVNPAYFEHTRNYIFTLAAERQRALSLDHPQVQGAVRLS